MSSVSVSHPSRICRTSIRLPSSKSISNRALILQALSKADIHLSNLSAADDTQLMVRALQLKAGEINLKNAGTCMRFLTAYYACMEGSDMLLLCDTRMTERPIDILVEALKELGAEINYLGEKGYPPLHIRGKKPAGGRVEMDATVSSQFISALMMIAPTCEQGLEIITHGSVSSEPYIRMTAALMQQFGYEVSMEKGRIHIRGSQDQSAESHITIGADWSAASYWYEIAAMSVDSEIALEGLQKDSIQGDAIIAYHMELFGVATTYTDKGIILTKKKDFVPVSSATLNLLSCPDLAPALAVTASALNIPTSMIGLQSLTIKESNRLLALECELMKCGYHVEADQESLSITGHSNAKFHQVPLINTYHDHRIAMAFAALGMKKPVRIDSPSVVGKSYPGFWEDMKLAGFIISGEGI